LTEPGEDVETGVDACLRGGVGDTNEVEDGGVCDEGLKDQNGVDEGMMGKFSHSNSR
jgi:hypothetical protein